jgi:hypothetical protein
LIILCGTLARHLDRLLLKCLDFLSVSIRFRFRKIWSSVALTEISSLPSSSSSCSLFFLSLPSSAFASSSSSSSSSSAGFYFSFEFMLRGSLDGALISYRSKPGGRRECEEECARMRS